MKIIYLAGGCFWGTEAYFKIIKGVVETSVGYANGLTKNPTYKSVCKGDTNHAETVKIVYDEEVVLLETLLLEYFKIIDPTLLNRQGGDTGTQYRTGIYYVYDEDKVIISNVIEREQEKYKEKIVVEVLPLICFYEAEEYHQNYLYKNPYGYCHINLNSISEDLKK